MTKTIEIFGRTLPEWEVAAIGAAALLVLITLGIGVRRFAKWEASAGVKMATVVAVIATGVSMNTSWRFFGDDFHITNVGERAFFFFVIEAALVTFAVMARENSLAKNEDGEASGDQGTPGLLVWVMSFLAMIAAWIEAGAIEGTARALFGPFLAAVLWHYALGLEVRRIQPKIRKDGVLGALARTARTKLLARLGAIDPDQSAEEVAANRAMVLAVRYGNEYDALGEAGRKTRKGRRLERRLRDAVRRSGVGTDLERRTRLMAELDVTRYAASLVTAVRTSPWDMPVPALVAAVEPPAALAPQEPADNSQSAPAGAVLLLDEEDAQPPAATETDEPGHGPGALPTITIRSADGVGLRPLVPGPDPAFAEAAEAALNYRQDEAMPPKSGTLKDLFFRRADELTSRDPDHPLLHPSTRIAAAGAVLAGLGRDVPAPTVRKYSQHYWEQHPGRKEPAGHPGTAAAE